jgi:C_GCAxxG_C_C family probable redox protein
MMPEEKAVDFFQKGFNCSQSVCAALGPRYGMPEDLCLKAACAFGAGIGRMQGVCGAVTGAFMVLGLKHGSSREGEAEKKEQTYRRAVEFRKRFFSVYGSVVCRELLDWDITTDEGLKSAKEKNLFSLRCEKYVAGAVSILQEILGEKE